VNCQSSEKISVFVPLVLRSHAPNTMKRSLEFMNDQLHCQFAQVAPTASMNVLRDMGRDYQRRGETVSETVRVLLRGCWASIPNAYRREVRM
jgi:hypothetical protein